MAPTTDELIQTLGLVPHPSGCEGFFAETFRDTTVHLEKDTLPDRFLASRAVSTAVYFLAPTGNISSLHRIPATEMYHFYMGEPLTVVEIDDSGKVTRTVLGNDLAAGQKLQHAVLPGIWFGAYPTLDLEAADKDSEVVTRASPRDPKLNYSLVGCTVAPAFEFADFQLGKRDELLDMFPHARDIIVYLTRPEEEGVCRP
eukprot:TRINITY_DN2049_c0_g1_i1.p2 TRINITY_DN2049_c0_g1~~TRINITY_DN2049_c0_g1_i1.p2  ORF type:complete len:200 (+),score=20.16 TRINITY_DN2049_c0_g1_i1:159-758(+)